MGKKRSITHVTGNAEENLSVPPGFVSLTSLTFKKIVASEDAAVEGEHDSGLVSNSDIERFKASLVQRPWISHGQFESVRHQDNAEQLGDYMRDPVGACLRKGVIRGCANCQECVKVTARWHPEESCLPVLDDALILRPTEEEFKEPMKYIAKIRPRAESYGICRIVPPPSWRPPLLLKNKEIWEASKFSTHVQKVDDLRNLFLKKRSRLHETIELPKDAANVELESCNECVGDSEEAKAVGLVSESERGPAFTLKSFNKYADDFKAQFFCETEKVIATDQNQSKPLIARIESEYWRIVDNPSEEIEVLFGTDLANQTLPSGFPVVASPAKDMDKYAEYVESGWNVNNTPNLYDSFLRFGCYNSSTISVPQMFIGMCFASQCWRNEDHHLYSLSYMHMGSPKVWYCIPGKYCFKFMELVKKRFPQLSKHPKLLHELVPQLSPSMLISEGIPVYRCLQNPLEFVVTFPGAYHSEFSCGFNCSETVCFAPMDWLPHGQNIIEVYAGYCFKTSLSHDKLLLGAAIEAVAALWDYFAKKRCSSITGFWRSVSGKNGILTRLLKLRVKNEGLRRKHLCTMSMSRAKFDVATQRECSICLYDLYLSAVTCSCSPSRYSCLRHIRQLCSCAWSAKQFFIRYEMTELNLLVEALEGNLKALHSWAKRKDLTDASLQLNRGDQINPNGSSSVGHTSVVARCKHVVTASGERRAATCTSPPPVTSPQNAAVLQSASNTSTLPSTRTSSDHNVVVLLSDDEE